MTTPSKRYRVKSARLYSRRRAMRRVFQALLLPMYSSAHQTVPRVTEFSGMAQPALLLQ
jgi:hypothetical protein